MLHMNGSLLHPAFSIDSRFIDEAVTGFLPLSTPSPQVTEQPVVGRTTLNPFEFQFDSIFTIRNLGSIDGKRLDKSRLSLTKKSRTKLTS
jgi:hypothetical protein